MAAVKLPTRPAPEPPDNLKKKNLISNDSKNNRDTFLERFKLSRSRSTGKLRESKKPPPRPPPPRQLKLTSLKSSMSTSSALYASRKSSPLDSELGAQCGLLIDLNSPPGSPTPTLTSLDSFGSGMHSGSSQIESGFEDDFDSLIISNSTTSSSIDHLTDDIFSIKRPNTQNVASFELSNVDPRSKHKEFNSTIGPTSTKPTIIRPKNAKPSRPPPPKLRPASTPPKFVTSSLDRSPPMPSIPPPPPPPEVINGPSVPPRPSASVQVEQENRTPYCIALYDYDAGHPDDISFKVNDVINLKEKIDDNWMIGQLHSKEGMFPVNYTKIVVPLETSTKTSSSCKHVIALYSFRAETWDDLPFQEGDEIKVIRRINTDWLFGECNGRKGQFPENYVADVSAFFPLRHS